MVRTFLVYAALFSLVFGTNLPIVFLEPGHGLIDRASAQGGDVSAACGQYAGLIELGLSSTTSDHQASLQRITEWSSNPKRYKTEINGEVIKFQSYPGHLSSIASSLEQYAIKKCQKDAFDRHYGTYRTRVTNYNRLVENLSDLGIQAGLSSQQLSGLKPFTFVPVDYDALSQNTGGSADCQPAIRQAETAILSAESLAQTLEKGKEAGIPPDGQAEAQLKENLKVADKALGEAKAKKCDTNETFKADYERVKKRYDQLAKRHEDATSDSRAKDDCKSYEGKFDQYGVLKHFLEPVACLLNTIANEMSQWTLNLSKSVTNFLLRL